ncbi:MAG: hypothetical protein COA54_11030 [Thiotrichaceae bacterium]|nr:MAG: hypothetical protein COA54_11030 [Thiotrichaceae bacterium]
MELFEYKDVVGISGGALGFYISGNLNALGWSYNRYTSPEAWMEWQNKQWEKQKKIKNANPKERKINRVERNGMDCWRIETKSYLKKSGTIDEYEQSNLGVYYQCWSEDRATYPPIDLGAGMTYRNGKPLYPDLDIDKDILSPVFETLKLKEIPPKKYEKIVKENIDNYQKKCKESYLSYKKIIKKKKGLVNDYRVNSLIQCGYDAAELKSLRCDSLREDLLMVKSNFILMSSKQYFSKKEHVESMLSCGYSDEEVSKFHIDACQISYQRAHDLNKNKSFTFNYYYIDYLEKCGFLVEQFQQ